MGSDFVLCMSCAFSLMNCCLGRRDIGTLCNAKMDRVVVGLVDDVAFGCTIGARGIGLQRTPAISKPTIAQK